MSVKSSSRVPARIIALFALLFSASLALASGSHPYDAKAFEAAQNAGKPILVEIHADWCPECKAQDRIMSKLSGDPAFAQLIRFRVDFDHQKDVVRTFKARMQSTLVLYKGHKEVARTVGETDEGKIRAMLTKAI